MKAPRVGSAAQPFPRTRPRIDVQPSRAKPFVVDGRVMPGWGVLMKEGATAWMSWYDPPDWKLANVSHMHVVRPAEIHGLEGLEIEMLDWEPPDHRWRPHYTHFARLTAESFEWLAISQVRDGKRVLHTFLDDGFEADWGEHARRLEDKGRLVAGGDGTYTLKQPRADGSSAVVGAGVFRVTIASRRFTCLRVLDIDVSQASKVALERGILSESFYTKRGDLILFRRYNGRLWKVRKRSPYAGESWDKRFTENARLIINGAMFVHWYDCLTDVASF